MELAVPYWQCMPKSVILASAARLSLHREQSTGAGPRKYADLIGATKTSRAGTYFIPSSLRLWELQPEKAVLSVRPDAFRPKVTFRYTRAFSDPCHLPVCSSQSQSNHGNLSRLISIILYGF